MTTMNTSKRRNRAKYLETVVPETQFGAAAILTLDPASSGDCGLCLRSTKTMLTPLRGKLRPPDWTYAGSVWNDTMHDELGVELSKMVPRGSRVCYVSASTAFGPRIALSLGRAIGCIEGLLRDLNILSEPALEVADSTWRKTELAHVFELMRDIPQDTARRNRWKREAVESVMRLYALECTDDTAEAVLLNDHVVLHRPDLWRPTVLAP